jgi:hypothetical protein
MKHYKLNTFANGFGIWHADILFTSPIGNTGEAQRIISYALTNAKRAIRREIQERQSGKVKRLSYEVVSNNELSTGQLTALRIREK